MCRVSLSLQRLISVFNVGAKDRSLNSSYIYAESAYSISRFWKSANSLFIEHKISWLLIGCLFLIDDTLPMISNKE